VTSAEIIETITERLAVAVPSGSRVVLFGSQARGDTHKWSDYDILVIEPMVEDRVGEAVRLRSELNGLSASIDVVVFDEAVAARRARVKGTLVDRALREGRVLAHT
jgi:uncharacterized protein